MTKVIEKEFPIRLISGLKYKKKVKLIRI